MDRIDSDDIEVSTATVKAAPALQTVPKAEAPAGGEPPVVEKKAEAAPAAKAGEEPAPKAAAAAPAADVDDLDPEIRAELDAIEPPKANETPAEKKARHTRAQKRIVSLARENKGLRDQLEQERRPKGDEPPSSAGNADEPPAAGAPAAPKAPDFKFETWDDYQAKNPDATYEQYQDARTDARYAYNRDRDAAVARATAGRDAAQRAAHEWEASEADYKAKPENATYDADIAAFEARVDPNAPAAKVLKRLLAEETKHGSAILHHLAKNPEDAAAVLNAPNALVLTQEFGAIKRDVVKASKAASPASGTKDASVTQPPAEPLRPATRAPAPVESPRGGGSTERSLASIADNDDADDYIARRTQERQAGGRR